MKLDYSELSKKIAYITINTSGSYLKSIQKGFEEVNLFPEHLIHISARERLKLEFKKYIAHELPGSMPVEGNAGDVLLFSECLIHMGNKKFTKGERINLYYLYSSKIH